MDLYEQIVRTYSDAEKQNTALRNVTSPLPLTPEETVEAGTIAKRLGEYPAGDVVSLEEARRRMATEMGVEAVQDPFVRDLLSDRRFAQLVYDSPEEWKRLGTLDKIVSQWKRGLLEGDQIKAAVTQMTADRNIEVDPLKNYGDAEMEEATEGGTSFEFLQKWASQKGNPLAVEAENLRREMQDEVDQAIKESVLQITGLERQLSALPENTAINTMQGMGWGQAISHMLQNPVDTLVSTTANSAAKQWQDWLLAGGASLLNPIAGASVIGQGSARTEFGASVLDQLKKRGVNIADAAEVAKAFRSEVIRKEVGMYGMKRAALVSAFDAGSAGSMLFGVTPLSAAVRVAQARGRAMGINLAKFAGRENKIFQSVIQAGAGGAGEYFGSKAVGETAAPADILMEMFSDLVTAPGELLAMRADTARHINVNRLKAELAMRRAQAIDSLSRVQEASSADSKGLASRSPEVFGEAVQRAVDGTEMAQATINPADVTSFQEELAQSAPDLAKRFADASQTGSEVQMPTGDLMALRTQNPGLADKLLTVSRFGNESMTLEEARAFAETYEKDLEDKVKALTAKELEVRAERDRKDAELEAATAPLRDQLRAAGVSEEEIAEQMAVFSANLEAFAEAAEMTPAEFMAANPLAVTGAQQSTDGTVQQTYQQNDNPNATDGPRGDFTPGSSNANGTMGLSLIRLFQSKNASTFCHEAAHYWLSTMMNRVGWMVRNATAGARKISAGEKRFLDLANDVLGYVLPDEYLGKRTAEMGLVERVAVWMELSPADRRKAHERFARGYEAYLWEGHCPVGRLASAFSNLSKWLRKIYLNASELGVQMTPEIVRMYDQLFAAQDAVAKDRQNLVDQHLYDDLRKAGATEEDIEGLSVLVDVSRETAEAKLRAAMQRDSDLLTKLRRKEEAGLRKEYDNIFRQRLAEINEMAGYRARRALGKGITGANGRLMRIRISKESAKALSEEDRKWLSAHHMIEAKNTPEGVEIYGAQSVAMLFDYENVTAMVEEMKACTDEKAEAEAKAFADEEFLSRHGEAFTDAGIEKLAARYLHNDAELRILATQVAALRNRLKDWKLIRQAVKAFVREDVDNMVYARQLPSGHWSVISDTNARYAAERAGRQADKARATGDVNAVANAKQAQLIQSSVVVAINDARDFGKAFADRCRRMLRSQTIEGAYMEQILFFSAKLGIPGGKMRPEGKPAWDAFVKDHPFAESLMSQLPENLQSHLRSESQEVLPWQSLKIGDIKALDRFLRGLSTQGRMFRRDKKTAQYRDAAYILDKAKEQAEARLAGKEVPQTNTDTDKSLAHRLAIGARRFLMWHVRFAFMIEALSGPDGELMKSVIYRANDIDTAEKVYLQKLAIRLNDIFDSFNSKGAYWEKPFLEYAGLSWSRHNIFSLALNAGNYGNLDRLHRGNGLTDEQINHLLSYLTEEELNAVNAVWAEFEELRKKSSEVCRKLDGMEPDWVAPRHFSVMTQDGKEVFMSGGYVPIKYDPKRNGGAADINEQIEKEATVSYLSAQTIRTYTKKRMDEGELGRAIQLDTEVVFSGMNEIVHDIYWREYVTDFNRLWTGCHTMEEDPNPDTAVIAEDGTPETAMKRVKHEGLNQLIMTYFGDDGHAVCTSWIKMIAFNGKMPGSQKTDAFGAQMRRFVSLAGLGFNFVSAAVQITGLMTAATVVSPGLLLNGLSKFATNPKANMAAVNAISPLMMLRSTTRIRELDEVSNTVLQGREGRIEKIRRAAYAPMMAVQSIVDYSVFNAAYQKALEEGKSPELARQEAEQTVIKTQGSGSVKDRSQVEVGRITSLFAGFYSYMGTALNLGLFNAFAEKDRPKAIANILAIYMLQPCVEELLRSAIQPSDDKDDDDENPVAKGLGFVVGNTVGFGLGTLIGFREASSMVKNLITGEDVFAYRGPSTVRLITDAVSMGQQLSQEEWFDKAFWKALINVIGDLGYLPSAQVNKTIDGAYAIAEGDTSNPMALLAGYKGK